MLRSTVNSILALLCTITLFRVGESKPLEFGDVVGLLPPEPKDVNETMAELVQDPVVKDAVQLAAANGSLNGLVVKRKTFIMPATEPDKVLSSREQVLVVPVEHLENVRKNITESKDNESMSIENLSSIENDSDRSVKSEESLSLTDEKELVEERQMDSDENYIRPSSGLSFQEFVPKFPPKNRPRTISVPVLAVVDPTAIEDGRVEASIVAVLPNKPGSTNGDVRVNFAEESGENIQRKTQELADGISVAARPETWNFVRTSPEGEIKHQQYPREVENMDVAEDIIFRPLFRYRQQERQRSRIRENNYRRSSYRQPYNTYEPYPRIYHRRPQYTDDFDY